MLKKIGQAVVALFAVGLLFVTGTAIAGAVNGRSFTDEIKSWGQYEQQVETPDDENNTDIETPEDENTEAGDETNTEQGE